MKRKSNNGITLIALIITIILMLILAGVVISLTIGKDGIIGIALRAKEEYKSAEEKEKKDLDELYSSIKVAGDSKVTLTMQELDDYINSKIQQPTRIRNDAYICNTRTGTSKYSPVNSMTGFTRTADEQNNISKYLSYSDQTGYTVLRSGWYFIRIRANISTTGSAASVYCKFTLNGNDVSDVISWNNANGAYDADSDSFSIYLKEGDEIYFKAEAYGGTATRNSVGYCYPMF